MKLNLFERIVLGIGVASVVLFLVATFGPLKSYREMFRILMLLSLGTYIVYTYLLQNKESNDRAELESQIASLEANNRALEQAKAAADSQLSAAQIELQGLRAALANAGLDAPVAGTATKKAAAPKKAVAPKKPAAGKTAAAAKKPAAKSTPAAKKPAAPRTPKAE
jgi:ribonuclease HI